MNSVASEILSSALRPSADIRQLCLQNFGQKAFGVIAVGLIGATYLYNEELYTGNIIFVSARQWGFQHMVQHLPQYVSYRSRYLGAGADGYSSDDWKIERDRNYHKNRIHVLGMYANIIRWNPSLTSFQSRLQLDLSKIHLAAREKCIKSNTCKPNQEKRRCFGSKKSRRNANIPSFFTVILVIDGAYLHGLVSPLHMSGEQIWARSAIAALDELNYTRAYHFTSLKSISKVVNKEYGDWDNIEMVITGPTDTRNCARDPQCFYSKEVNPTGVPL
jgi:hypothetical protein